MVEGKRMEHLEDDKREKGSKKRREKLEGKRVGEENVEERRGEVIGVCLCTYIYIFSPLSNTVDVGSD